MQCLGLYAKRISRAVRFEEKNKEEKTKKKEKRDKLYVNYLQSTLSLKNVLAPSASAGL